MWKGISIASIWFGIATLGYFSVNPVAITFIGFFGAFASVFIAEQET